VADEDPTELADQLQHEADALARHSQELERDTQEVRQDWERKRRDPSVPGAPPRETAGEEPEAEFPAKAESLAEEEKEDG
jgi:hypothetical protein